VRKCAAGAAAGAERGEGAPRATVMGVRRGEAPRLIDRLAAVEHDPGREISKVLAQDQAAAMQP
jgi:hypothetical protein